MVPRILIAAGNYGALSLVEIAFRAIQPLFFATPVELGGLGLDPPRIGSILSIYGVVSGLFQVFFFADLHDRYGSKVIYTVAMASGIPIILTFPLINALAGTQGLGWMVWPVVGTQLALFIVLNLGYGKHVTASPSVLLIDVVRVCLQHAYSFISSRPLQIVPHSVPLTVSPSFSCRSCAPSVPPRRRPCFQYPSKHPNMHGLCTIIFQLSFASGSALPCCSHARSGIGQRTRNRDGCSSVVSLWTLSKSRIALYLHTACSFTHVALCVKCKYLGLRTVCKTRIHRGQSELNFGR